MPNFDVESEKNREKLSLQGVPEAGQNGSPAAGNERELLKIASGRLLVIDQFMLANQQFIAPFMSAITSSGDVQEAAIEICGRFGGAVVPLNAGEYGVYRNSHERFMVVYPLDAKKASSEAAFPYESFDSLPNRTEIANVVIDTRAVVFIDLLLLQNDFIRSEFLNLWQAAKRKEARDLLRANGCAVRYGFSHRSDCLQLARPSEEETEAINDILIVTADRLGIRGESAPSRERLY